MSQQSAQSSPMDYEELIQKAKDSVTPIDFESLTASGVLEQKGAWYKVHKWNELPEHAKAKISSIKSGKPPLVKFRKPSKKLEKFLRKEMKDK